MKKNKKVIDDKDLNNVSGGVAINLEEHDKVANNDDNNPLAGIAMLNNQSILENNVDPLSGAMLNNQSILENNVDPQETIGTNVGKRKIDS